jgi:hypothetical protein
MDWGERGGCCCIGGWQKMDTAAMDAEETVGRQVDNWTGGEVVSEQWIRQRFGCSDQKKIVFAATRYSICIVKKIVEYYQTSHLAEIVLGGRVWTPCTRMCPFFLWAFCANFFWNRNEHWERGVVGDWEIRNALSVNAMDLHMQPPFTSPK